MTRDRVCNRTILGLNWGFKQNKTRNLRPETQQSCPRLPTFTSALGVSSFSSEHIVYNLQTFKQQSVKRTLFIFFTVHKSHFGNCSLLWSDFFGNDRKVVHRVKKATPLDLKLHDLFFDHFQTVQVVVEQKRLPQHVSCAQIYIT